VRPASSLAQALATAMENVEATRTGNRSIRRWVGGVKLGRTRELKMKMYADA
jgi:hypothetical protein